MSTISVPRPHQGRRRAFVFEGSGDVNPWASDVDHVIDQIIHSLGQAQRLFAQLTNQTSAATGRVALHASTHLPSGTDPLPTAAPSSILGGTSSNQKGVGNSFARSDHSHDVATGAHTGGYGTTAAEGSSNNLLRGDAVFEYPKALMSPTSSFTLTATDDATDITLTGSTGALNLRSGTRMASLPLYVAGGEGAATLGIILGFNQTTSIIGDDNLSRGLQSYITFNRSGGAISGLRESGDFKLTYTTGTTFTSARLHCVETNISRIAAFSSGTHTFDEVFNCHFFTCQVPTQSGGGSVTTTSFGLFNGESLLGIQSALQNPGVVTNAWGFKYSMPNVGVTIRRGHWITGPTVPRNSNTAGTEANVVEGYYIDPVRSGLVDRKSFAGEGTASGAMSGRASIFEQVSVHSLGATRFFGYGLNACHLENPSGIGQSVLELKQLNTGTGTGAHINFDDKAGDPTTKVAGDFWRNGIALKWYDGTVVDQIVGQNTTDTLSNKTLNDVTMANAKNIILATGTGTQIGTGPTQKLGLWGAAPVVQPATTGTASSMVAGGGAAVDDKATFTGGLGATAYRIDDMVLALKQLGGLKQ